MFETIGTLFTIAVWAIAIFLFAGGIIICIANIISGDGLEKVLAVIALILGAYTFFRVYEWLDSIVWCLLATGLVTGLVSGAFSGHEEHPSGSKEPGLIDTFTGGLVEGYTQYEITKQAVKDANRESK